MSFESQLLANMPSLYSFALKLTHNVDDAQDLFQTTLLKALSKKALFKKGTNLRGWTSKIMFNLFISQKRHDDKMIRLDPQALVNQTHTPPDQQEVNIRYHQTLSTINQLTRKHAQVIMLVCWEGLDYQSAANTLNIPIGTLRSRLSRARYKLEQRL